MKPWQRSNPFLASPVILKLVSVLCRVAKRSTKNEVTWRIQAVYQQIVDGWSMNQICQEGSENWGVSTRQVERYIAEARLLIEKDCSISREALMAEAFAAYRSLRQTAERRGQCMAALKAVENMTALAGLGK